ncbi:MAG TPA: L-fucose:H+ symporter permease [Bryobacteraceae bacterium]|jgi:FHS family L-fucose permease-like MFS transporter
MAIANTGKAVSAGSTASRTNYGAMAMVTTLFFMWGFLTALNDIIIPHLKAIFDLNFAQVLLVQFTFFSGYVVFAFPAGKLVERIGYQKTMVTGLLIMALGAFLFVPAASAPSFPFFLTALIILAAGITALQVSANPYVSVLGPPQTASSRLNLAQAFNSLGTTIAPNFGSLLILSAAPMAISEIHKLAPDALHAYRLHEAATVKIPYIGLGLTLVALAIVIALFRLPKIAGEEHVSAEDLRKAGSVWKRKHLVLGALGIFLYVGAEVAIGSFLVNYFVLPDIGAMTVKAAGFYLSLYWMCAMIGRFVGSAVLQKLPTGPLLGAVAIAACGLVAASMLSHGWMAVWTIILVGLFNSIMFPSIFTLGIAELGPLTGEGSGILVAAIVGGAIIPELEGLLADSIGIHYAFILPALCYIYIAFYGFRGSKPVTAIAA